MNNKIIIFIFIKFIIILIFCIDSVYADKDNQKAIKIFDHENNKLIQLDKVDNNYDILSKYGKISNNNLFHSFKFFNLYLNEIATFKGPDQINNIICRINGEKSRINGTIRSNINNANLYLLNPNGIIFEENASLDIDGSFYASTAHFLKFEDGNKLFSRESKTSEKSIFTSAKPSAFGFIDSNIESIEFYGKGEVTNENIANYENRTTGLSVNSGKNISIVGGDITFNGGTYYYLEEINDINYYNDTKIKTKTYKALGNITAPGGRIDIASVKSPCEISLNKNGFNITKDVKYGIIELNNKSLLDVSGEGAGSIFIKGEKFILNNSSIYANTTGNKKGGILNISATKSIILDEGSRIIADVGAKEIDKRDISGTGANIILNAEESIMLKGEDEKTNDATLIQFNTHATNVEDSSKEGYAGDISIKADTIKFENGASIWSLTFGKGNASNIKINGDSLICGGKNKDSYLNSYYNVNFKKNRIENHGVIVSVATPESEANSGKINIDTKNEILLKEGFLVSTLTMGQGNAGDIEIKTKNLTLKDSFDFDYWSSAIYSSTFSVNNINTGDAGNLTIDSVNITLENGGCISSSSQNFSEEGFTSGNPGTISIKAENIIARGVNPFGQTSQYQRGNPYGSNIAVFNMQNKQETDNEKNGLNENKGLIDIKAKNITLEDGAMIIAFTSGKGQGSDVKITENDNLILKGKSDLKFYNSIRELPVKLAKSGINSSSSGSGEAGNISIESKNIKLLDGAIISSESKESPGGLPGKITIKANSIELKNNSKITTEAQNIKQDENVKHDRKLIGSIEIDSPKINLFNSEITTSVKGGSGNGGNININANQVIMNNSLINANAFEGNGGNVHISSNHFVKSSNSSVNASSEKGIDGNISIGSPDVDFGSDLIAVSEEFLDTSMLMSEKCENRISKNISRFVISSKDGIPTSPDDWLASPYILSIDNDFFKSSIIFNAIQAYNNGNFKKTIQIIDKILISNSEHLFSIELAELLSKSYQATGFFQKPLNVLKKFLPVFKNKSNHYKNAIYLKAIGDLFLCLKNKNILKQYFKEFKDYNEVFEKALNEARKTRKIFLIACILNDLGNAFSSIGDFDEAIEHYDASYQLCYNHDQPDKYNHLKTIALINKARALAANNNTGSDLKIAINDALMAINNLEDSYHKASNLVSICQIIQTARLNIKNKKSYKNQMFVLLNNAIRLSKKYKNTSILSYAYFLKSKFYESIGLVQDAIILADKAILKAQKYPELLFRWHRQKGHLLTIQNKIIPAIFEYDYAVRIINPSDFSDDVINKIHGTYRSNDTILKKDQKSSYFQPGVIHEIFVGYRSQDNIFRKCIKPVYQEFAELLLMKANNTIIKDQEAILFAVMKLMDSLKTVELKDFYEDECFGSIKSKKTRITYSQLNTAIIYPIFLKKDLSLIAILPDKLSYVNIHDCSDKIRNYALQFRKFLDIELNQNPDRYRRFARKIYKWLIDPFEKQFNEYNIKTIVFVPDDALRLIPISVLLDNDQFLVEKYCVVTIPAICLTDTSSSDLQLKSNIMLAGLSKGEPPLPWVTKELNDIKSILGNGTILLDENFIKKNITNEFKQNAFEIAVISTHGSFGKNINETYLETYDGKLYMNDIENLIKFGMIKNQQMELISLSACKTAMGDERAALGLAGIAVKAGAKSALATLWSVSDEVTYLAITEFYKQIKKSGVTKAKALQLAQINLIHSKKYCHPSFWAPFLLIGNWL